MAPRSGYEWNEVGKLVVCKCLRVGPEGNMKEMGFIFLNTVGQWTKIIVRREEDELPRFPCKEGLPSPNTGSAVIRLPTPSAVHSFRVCLSCRSIPNNGTFLLEQPSASEWLQEISFQPTREYLWWTIYSPKSICGVGQGFGGTLQLKPFLCPILIPSLLFHGCWFLINIPHTTLSHHLLLENLTHDI